MTVTICGTELCWRQWPPTRVVGPLYHCDTVGDPGLCLWSHSCHFCLTAVRGVQAFIDAWTSGRYSGSAYVCVWPQSGYWLSSKVKIWDWSCVHTKIITFLEIFLYYNLIMIIIWKKVTLCILPKCHFTHYAFLYLQFCLILCQLPYLFYGSW